MASTLATRRAPLLLSSRLRAPLHYRTLSTAAAAASSSSLLTPRASPSSPRIAQQSRICAVTAATRRTFSATAAPHAADKNTSIQKQMTRDLMKQRLMPSATAASQQQKLDNVPSDLGLMPETFVRPTGKNAPSWTAEPGLRWRMEKHWVKTRVYDVMSRLVYKFTTVKPRPVIHRRGLGALALRLHRDMYTAFAFGDVEHLNRICTDGVATSFRTRIHARKPDERLYWMRLAAGRPRIVSDRVVKVPVPGVGKEQPCCVRQVIFRIKSKQALVKGNVRKERGSKGTVVVDAKGEELPLDADGEVVRERMEREVRSPVEYFVLQKRMWMGKEERQWMVWGLVDETSLDEIL